MSEPFDTPEAIDPGLPYHCAPNHERQAFIEVARRRQFLSMVQLLAQSAREHGFSECSALLSETHEKLIRVLYQRPLPTVAMMSSLLALMQAA